MLKRPKGESDRWQAYTVRGFVSILGSKGGDGGVVKGRRWRSHLQDNGCANALSHLLTDLLHKSPSLTRSLMSQIRLRVGPVWREGDPRTQRRARSIFEIFTVPSALSSAPHAAFHLRFGSADPRKSIAKTVTAPGKWAHVIPHV